MCVIAFCEVGEKPMWPYNTSNKIKYEENVHNCHVIFLKGSHLSKQEGTQTGLHLHLAHSISCADKHTVII